jgi:hypothetical protein
LLPEQSPTDRTEVPFQGGSNRQYLRMTSVSDAIWNRAAMDAGGPSPRSGDAALASLLRVHNLAMSGGLLDALDRLSPGDLDAAQNGYRFFDLPEAADVIGRVRSELGRNDLSDGELEALEGEADQRYAEVVATDQVIVDRFEARLTSDPEAFAPA